MQAKTSRFTERMVSLAQKADVGRPAPAFRPGEGGYADWVIIAIQGLNEYLDHPYRKLMGVIKEMPKVTRMLGLNVETVPNYSTVCAYKQRLRMKSWRAVLDYSVELHDLGEVQAIDATGVDRIAASQHYAKRTTYTFQAVKRSLLVDCETNIILDIHWSMKQPHDTQVGWQRLTRNIDKLSTVTADKEYDWELLRRILRSENFKPMIKARSKSWTGILKNTLIDDTTYHQRSNAESVFFGLRRRYGDTLWSRTWFGQFR